MDDFEFFSAPEVTSSPATPVKHDSGSFQSPALFDIPSNFDGQSTFSSFTEFPQKSQSPISSAPGSGLLDFEPEVYSPSSPAQTDFSRHSQKQEQPENLIRKFEEERQQDIEKSREVAEAKRKEQVAQANTDVQKFYGERRKATEERASRNRHQLEEKQTTVVGTSDPANVWKNVRELVDIKNSKSEGRDVSRMREIILSL
eukprot:TRINITY_DN8258_c0_g1_i1.p1 TRINITY_DN8258_c0_g1~~TRINITY_DN8258_c0_g1_i1.p1  ORF type:complete len:201 (-),score=42.52 TRINITY_DN8258_c0_g1_i1:53-655(-)